MTRGPGRRCCGLHGPDQPARNGKAAARGCQSPQTPAPKQGTRAAEEAIKGSSTGWIRTSVPRSKAGEDWPATPRCSKEEGEAAPETTERCIPSLGTGAASMPGDKEGGEEPAAASDQWMECRLGEAGSTAAGGSEARACSAMVSRVHPREHDKEPMRLTETPRTRSVA